MNEILIMLHFFGLGAGFAAAIGNPIVLRAIMASPGDAPVLAKLQPRLALAGQIGLGLLWLTGLILVWSRYGGPGNLPGAFWIKIVCVLVITAAVIALRVLGQRAAAGDQSARARMPIIGMTSGAFLLLAVIFAVIAFH